jgi:mRNA interferase MazF
MNRFDIYLVTLDPTEGYEMKKTRPCVIVSPNEMNYHIQTVIIAPMTKRGHGYPTRVPITFEGQLGEIVLDQLRTVDKSRLLKKLGQLDSKTARQVLFRLAEMFSE